MVGWNCGHNPVITPGGLNGDFDALRAGAAHVMRVGSTYRMVYWGTDSDGRNHILSAEAPVDSPNQWTPLGSLVTAQPDKPRHELVYIFGELTLLVATAS